MNKIKIKKKNKKKQRMGFQTKTVSNPKAHREVWQSSATPEPVLAE
jgi:hypothetical protein